MGLNLSKVDGAKVMKSSPFFVAGNYELKVIALREVTNYKKENFFCAEFEIVASDTDERKPGTEVCWLVKETSDYFESELKLFFGALLGIEPEAVTAAAISKAIAKNNPHEGDRIVASARTIDTKKGGQFTRLTWSNPNDEDAAA